MTTCSCCRWTLLSDLRVACALPLLLGAAVLAWQDSRPGAAPASRPDTGAALRVAVQGTITLARTKVKTDGPKSDKDVVVWLLPVPPATFEPPKAPVAMDQRNLIFLPHVLAVQKGTVVQFLNNDAVPHNVFCVDECCAGMDLGQWNQGEKRTWTFTKVGIGTLLCRLHPEMAAYVVVVDSPWFTVAAIDEKSQQARYAIAGAPAGKYRLCTWSKRLADVEREVVVTGDAPVTCDLELGRRPRK